MNTSDVIKLPRDTLSQSVKALRRLATYELEPAIQSRMQDLGERKEFLDESEHAELLSLIEFSEHRTVERLEAEVALQKIEEAVPDLPKAS